MPHEVDDAAVERELLRLLVARPLVVQRDRETAVQERHHLQSLRDRRVAELELLEHVRVGPEGHGGSRVPALGLRHDLQLSLRDAGPHRAPARLLGRVLLPVRATAAVDLEHDPRRQRVHHRHTHAVQSARHLVAAAAELAARVQRGHHDLRRRLALVLGVLVDGDPAAVVGDTDRAVGEQRDVDARARPRHRLVDRVVDDFPHEVVEAGRPGRTDVHARSFSHRVEALEHLNVLGGVVTGGGSGHGSTVRDRCVVIGFCEVI